uniref:Uncharacterized protein n=1 Tax=Salix viminalis TaxID=40686 RepID=A0A6N2LEQ9_SALVM
MNLYVKGKEESTEGFPWSKILFKRCLFITKEETFSFGGVNSTLSASSSVDDPSTFSEPVDKNLPFLAANSDLSR